MIENYDDSNIQSFEYETTIVSDSNIVGTCELGKATIQMLNSNNEYSSLKNTWIKTIHGSMYIYDVEPVQENVNIKLSCYDIKYKLDTDYDKELYIDMFPTTLKEWRNAIADNCGITFDNSDFPNSDLVLEEHPYIEDNSSNRSVMKIIAQAGASNIITDNNDIFYFSWFEDIEYTVNDWIELTTEKKSSNPINTIVLGRGDVEDNVYYPLTSTEDNIEFRIDNNYILDPQEPDIPDRRYEVIEPIYNRIKGFSYLVFNMKTQDIDNRLSIKLGQRIKYEDIYDNTLTAYVMSKKIAYLGGDPLKDNNYEITLSAEEIKENSTDYSYASSVSDRLKKTERTTDKISGTITDLIKENKDNSEKISQVEQTVESISQQVSETLDLTNEITGKYFIETNDAVQGDALNLSIYGQLDLLYPSEELIPSETLSPRDSYLIIEDKDGNKQKILLPFKHLNYLNDDTYDELIITPDKTEIIRRVKINEDGTKQKLNNETIESYRKVSINLNYEYNKIYLESFRNNNANFKMEYVIKNKFSDVYATRSELKSSITQTEENINLEVSKKVGDDEIISKINQSAEKIQINADKISLEGKEINLTSENIVIDSDNFSVDKEGNIKSTSGLIGGYTIGKDSLYALNYATTNYTQSDMDLLRNYLNNQATLTDEQKKYFDANGDGKLDSIDLLRMKKQLMYGVSTTNPSKIIMNGGTNGYDSSYEIIDGNNISRVLINYSGITISDGSSQSHISSYSVESPEFINNSLATNKKNFKKFTNALSIINNIDLYKYNYKNENSSHKKHIGLVIGKGYKYSSDITSVNEEGKEVGINLYSMASLCLQAIKEQQELIEKLQNKILELEEKINDR